jgi:hypothetical protein
MGQMYVSELESFSQDRMEAMLALVFSAFSLTELLAC